MNKFTIIIIILVQQMITIISTEQPSSSSNSPTLPTQQNLPYYKSSSSSSTTKPLRIPFVAGIVKNDSKLYQSTLEQQEKSNYKEKTLVKIPNTIENNNNKESDSDHHQIETIENKDLELNKHHQQQQQQLEEEEEDIITYDTNPDDDSRLSISNNNTNNNKTKGAKRRRLKTQALGEQEEKLLLRKLLQGYEKHVRPVRLAKQPVLIQVGITLTQIFDMDEKNQVLTTNVWLDQEWYDELLQWNPVDYGGLDSIRLPCKLIWLPDIVLYNNADDYTRGYMPSRAMVSHDGKVFWPPPTKFRSTCPVDVTYFPFDDQICTLKLGSWTYNGFQVDITNRTSEVDLSNYVQNGEWELLGAELQRNVVFYSCCVEPFPDVTVTLIIRRKTLYYIYNIVLPCMMLSILTLLVFYLPPDSGEKIALGITVLLAFSVFMLAIAEKMPETSESIPLIGIYLTAVMVITSISVICTVIVLNLHYLGPRVQPIPSWLRCFLPKDDIDFLREKSLLLFQNCTAKTGGNRRIQPHYLISHQSLYQQAPTSYSTSIPPLPTHLISRKNKPTLASSFEQQEQQGHPGTASPTENAITNRYTTQNNRESFIRNNNKNSSTTTTTGSFTPLSPHQLLSTTRRSVDLESGAQDLQEENEEGQEHLSSNESVDDDDTGINNTNQERLRQESRSLFAPKLRNRNYHQHQQQYIRPTMNHVKAKTRTYPSPKRLTSPRRGSNNINTTTSPSLKKEKLQLPISQTFMKVQQDLLKSIQHLLHKQEELEFQNLLIAEWRLVAQVVDRILFWIFFLITVASSGIFLVILPLYKRSWETPK